MLDKQERALLPSTSNLAGFQKSVSSPLARFITCSCHCGDVQYQVRLKFPPTNDTKVQPIRQNPESIRFYKCNCSICQKMGFFHCRPMNPAEDFILTSPATIVELGDYRANSGKAGYYFCKKCGVRVFGVGAIWQQVDLDVEKWASMKKKDEVKELKKVWTTKETVHKTTKDGKEITERLHYVSINAVTLEPGEDIDLRKWHENGWVQYEEGRMHGKDSQVRIGQPHVGGMY